MPLSNNEDLQRGRMPCLKLGRQGVPIWVTLGDKNPENSETYMVNGGGFLL
jgi:hypothetical protein